MKEVFKKICEETYFKFYDQIVEYFAKELSEKQFHNEKPNLNDFVFEIAKKSFETFIADDFTVHKAEGSVSYLSGLSFDEHMATLFNVKEKNLNVIMMPSRNFITISEREMFELMRWDYKPFFEYNEDFYQINKEAKEEICNADFDVLLGLESMNFQKVPMLEYNDKMEEILSFYEVLKLLYGENEKTENYKAILKTYIEKFIKLNSLTLSQIYAENSHRFNEIAFGIIVKQIRNFNRQDIKTVIDYFDRKMQDTKILRLIFTFLYTKKSIDYNFDIDFLDFTFVAVEMFKLVEIVFNDLLNSYWADKKINFNNIDCSENELTLGEMEQFFYSNDKDIRNHLNAKPKYSQGFLNEFKNWRKSDRNGFTHKHVIQTAEQMQKSVDSSLKMICLLIIILTK